MPLLVVAIGIAELVVFVTPLSHPNLPEWLQALWKQPIQRFEQTDSAEELNRAIQLAEEVADLTPNGHSDRTRRLNRLGSWLGKRFERTGARVDLDRVGISHPS